MARQTHDDFVIWQVPRNDTFASNTGHMRLSQPSGDRGLANELRHDESSVVDDLKVKAQSYASRDALTSTPYREMGQLTMTDKKDVENICSPVTKTKDSHNETDKIIDAMMTRIDSVVHSSIQSYFENTKMTL